MKKVVIGAIIGAIVIVGTVTTLFALGQKEIVTEIIIQAPNTRVWSVLVNFTNYPQWNPFITMISGNLTEGEVISVRIEPPNQDVMDFSPTLLEVDNNTQIGYCRSC